MKLNIINTKLGFTLAEMLVVISILSILTAAALPVISKRERSSSSFSPGSIIAWDKPYIPDGYLICDAANNSSFPGVVPDLSESFIRATSVDNTRPNSGVGITDGSSSIDFTQGSTIDPADYLPLHSHILSVSNSGLTHTHSITLNTEYHTHYISFLASSHAHTTGIYTNGSTWSTSTQSANAKVGLVNSGTSLETVHIHAGTTSGCSPAHIHTITVSSETHNHPPAVSLSLQGSNSWSKTKPTYYALYYIIKM